MGWWQEGSDDDAQPLEQGFNAKRVAERTVDEMLGICKGVIADGAVNAAEADFLNKWLTDNPEVAAAWPANVLAERLRRIYADGRVDQDELDDLRELLQSVTGETQESSGAARKSTGLPLNDPPPAIVFADSLFCFTGKFVFGTRKNCEAEVEKRGGQRQSTPTQKTSYLIIGSLGSRDWIHTSHGRKIEAAIEIRDTKGYPLAIVGEAYWAGQF